MKKFVLSIVILLGISSAKAEHNELVISKERGTYQLNFNTTYVTYVNLDIELMISLPKEYRFAAAIPGSKDFIHASPVQNTMYVTKTCEGFFQTNLSMHVITPEGAQEKLIFSLVSKRRTPKVLAIHFTKPNASELNRTIEAIKARYNKQRLKQLSEQEAELNTVIHKESVSRGRVLFFKKRRGRIKISHKGADAYLDGMYNSRGDTYIFIKTDIVKDNYNVVKLTKAGLKGAEIETEYVSGYRNEDGAFTYIYRIPQISIRTKKKNRFRAKIQKVYLHFEIWSKKIVKRVNVS